MDMDSYLLSGQIEYLRKMSRLCLVLTKNIFLTVKYLNIF